MCMWVNEWQTTTAVAAIRRTNWNLHLLPLEDDHIIWIRTESLISLLGVLVSFILSICSMSLSQLPASHPYVLMHLTTLSLISSCLLAYLLLLLLLGFAPASSPPSRFHSIRLSALSSLSCHSFRLLPKASSSIHSNVRIIIPMIISPHFPFCPSYFHCSILVIAG